MYVYRALRANEFYNKLIYCKEYYKYAPLIGIPLFNNHFGNDALDLVGAHLTKGNTTITPWISCTKDYTRVKHYLYDKSEYIYGMAIIKNHSEDCLVSEKFSTLLYKYQNKDISLEQLIEAARKLYLADISKCVLDFSTGQSSLFDKLMACCLVRFGDDRIRPYMTRWEYNFAQSNSEVLVLGEIPKQDAVILDPLQIDLISFLQSKNIIGNINDELLDSITKKFIIYHSLLAVENIKWEEMLTEPLKSIYVSIPDILKEVFNNIYILKQNKKSYIQEKKITMEYLNMLINSLLFIILRDSGYLNELSTTSVNPNNPIKALMC